MRGSAAAKRAQPGTGGSERIAVFLEVPAEPARAEAEDEPAAGDPIDRPGHVGDEIGVAVRTQVTSGPISIRSVDSAQAASGVQHSRWAASRSPYSGKKWSHV